MARDSSRCAFLSNLQFLGRLALQLNRNTLGMRLRHTCNHGLSVLPGLYAVTFRTPRIRAVFTKGARYVSVSAWHNIFINHSGRFCKRCYSGSRDMELLPEHSFMFRDIIKGVIIFHSRCSFCCLRHRSRLHQELQLHPLPNDKSMMTVCDNLEEDPLPL